MEEELQVPVTREVTTRPDTGRRRVQTVNALPSKTVQADRDRADIRHIIRKYETTGVLINMAKVDLAFRDVTEFEDFGDLMQQAKEAEAAFMRLPAELRKVFRNDVNFWLDCAHDEEKLDELAPQLRKLGMLEQVDPTPPPAPEPDPPDREGDA